LNKKKVLLIIFCLICINIDVFSYEELIGRATFVKGSPVIINPTGQRYNLVKEYEFTNHSKFVLDDGERLELFIPERAKIQITGQAEFMVRFVGNEIQIISDFGRFRVQLISRMVFRWKNYQVVSEHSIFTAETLINDSLKISCLDGSIDLLENTDLKTTMKTTDRVIITRSGNIEEMNFGINTENLRWMDFKNVKATISKDTKVQLSDKDFVLPPGVEEELLVYTPEKKESTDTMDSKIRIEFSSPSKGRVNIGNTLKVAGRVNTVMVNSLEVYLDDTFLGNIEVKNFKFSRTFNIRNPSKAKFLDVIARDIYGNKAVFTTKLIPDTRAPVITIVPPFNTKKTQFFKGFVEDNDIRIVHISLNRGTIYEENFDIPCSNGYFQFKMTTDDKQSDAVLVRYGSNFIDIKAQDSFGNQGRLRYNFFIDRDLIETNAYFDK